MHQFFIVFRYLHGVKVGFFGLLLSVLSSAVWAMEDEYEIDNYLELASLIDVSDPQAQVHNFHQRGDVDWLKFYVKADYPIPYSILVNRQQANADAVLRVYDEAFNLISEVDDGVAGEGELELLELRFQKDGFYYIQISQHDPNVFGENTQYSVRLFHAEQKFKGSVLGRVIDANTGESIATPQITSSSSLRAPYIGGNNGAIIMSHPSGQYDISIHAENYQSLTIPSVQVKELQSTLIGTLGLTPKSPTIPIARNRFNPVSNRLTIDNILIPGDANYSAQLVYSNPDKLIFSLESIQLLTSSNALSQTGSFIAEAAYVQLPLVMMGDVSLGRVILELIPNSVPMQFKAIDFNLYR